MRHRVHGRKLGRTSAHRKALFRNQLIALFTHERIITTVAKAKELRPIAERMVTIARTQTLAARRKVAIMVPDRAIAKRLFDEIAPRFADRPGGYTRIMRLGRRHGDNAELAIIEFVDYELSEHRDSGEKGSKSSFLDRAKGMFGGGAAAEEGTTADDEAVETAETGADDEAIEVAAAEEPEAVEAEAAIEVGVDEPVEAEAVTTEEPVEEPVAEEAAEIEEVVDEPVVEEAVEVVADEPPAEEPEAAEPEAKADEAADDANEEKKDA